MIACESHELGTIVPVRAKAGARQNGVQGERHGRLLIAVTQAPEKGKANRAIAQVLAEWLEISPGRVELLSGETSPQKRFLVRGVMPSHVTGRLREFLGEGRNP